MTRATSRALARREVGAVSVIVLISALAGAALFGLIGALVAIPIAAAVILLVKEIVLPAKELS
jgi:predicted PurR-regulated permease PerM